MAEAPVIRLFHFRPVRPAFDAILRDVMIPDLVARPGLLACHVGRRGPDDVGPRLVATVWASRDAMSETLGEDFDPPTFHPEYLDETTDREVETLPLALSLRSDGPGPARIMRTFRGRVRLGELSAYVAEAHQGTLADIEAGGGPLALYLGTGPGDDAFITVSVWDGWSAVEAATGGDIGRPIATRHPARLVDWDAVHFEIIDT